jgi:hypothetical protein
MVVPEKEGLRSLREIEDEVVEEGREWTRQRLEKKLQEEVARHGEVFPPRPKKGAAPTSRIDGVAHQRRGR